MAGTMLKNIKEFSFIFVRFIKQKIKLTFLLNPIYLENKSINNCTMAPRCAHEKKGGMMLTLNQKLEIVS